MSLLVFFTHTHSLSPLWCLQRKVSTLSTIGSTIEQGNYLCVCVCVHNGKLGDFSYSCSFYLSLFASISAPLSLYLCVWLFLSPSLLINQSPFLNSFITCFRYPLGRIIGGTIYPGLMVTASTIYHLLNSINITLDVREVQSE